MKFQGMSGHQIPSKGCKPFQGGLFYIWKTLIILVWANELREKKEGKKKEGRTDRRKEERERERKLIFTWLNTVIIQLSLVQLFCVGSAASQPSNLHTAGGRGEGREGERDREGETGREGSGEGKRDPFYYSVILAICPYSSNIFNWYDLFTVLITVFWRCYNFSASL